MVRPGYFIRHRNRRLKLTTIRTQTDRNDASFMMTDAYTGAGAVVTETEEWKANLGKALIVESKAVPSYFWDAEQMGVDSNGVLAMEGHVFRVTLNYSWDI